MTVPDLKQRGVSSIERHFMTVMHHVSYGIARTFPKRIPITLVTGYPKSGTVWVTQMIADYLQLPFIDLSYTPAGCPAVLHSHYPITPKGPRSVYVLRDGRDTMVSMFHYLARLLEPGDNPTVPRSLKHALKNVPNREAVKEYMPQFIRQQFNRPTGSKYTWDQHITSYFDSKRECVPIVRYESLLENPHGEMKQALEILGISPIDDALEWTVQKFSFERQTGRNRGSEVQSDFVRKGTSGQWREVFTREAGEVFSQLAGDMLIRTGYEDNHDWVDDLQD